MKSKWFVCLVFIAIAIAIAATAYIFYSDRSPTKPQYTLVTLECWFDLPEPYTANCGELTVATPTITFQLPFVRFTHNVPDRREDPLVYLPGGPGSSSLLDEMNIDHWLRWLDRAELQRDLVLMDQRGTGLSRPQFVCHDFNQYLRNSLGNNFTPAQEAQALQQAITACQQQFTAQGFNYEQFSTSVSANDLQQLMTLLGYRQWNVMGASYGTRVAMDWSKRYPQSIRAMILDSAYPPGRGGLIDWPENLARAFQVLWPSCHSENGCESRDQQQQAQFWRAVDKLNEQAVVFDIPLWRGDWPVKTLVNGQRFIFIAYNALYRPSGAEKITTAIKDILADKNSEALEQITTQSVNSDLDPDFNAFTYFLVDCSENKRPTAEEFEQKRQQFPLFLRVTEEGLENDACASFPLIESFKEFVEGLPNQTPSLFLSGGLDPATPSRWVDDVLPFYPKGQVWNFPDLGHGVSANNDCVMQSLNRFLDNPKQALANPC